MNILLLGPSDMSHLRRLAPALAARGHKIHLVSKRSTGVPGATFERFEVPRAGPRYPYRWHRRAEVYMRRLIARFDVTTVHFVSEWPITQDAADGGCLTVRPYGSDIDPPPQAQTMAASVVEARRTLLRLARGIVAPSRWFADKVVEFAGIDRANITTMSMGIDLDRFSPVRPNRRSPRTVGYFKGFEPVYGPMTMINAIPLVHARLPNVRFDLVGKGRLRDDCRRRAEQLGIGAAIRWFDLVPHEDIPNLLSQWDVAAVTSWKESLCVAALEASAMQIPVVASNVGGLRESGLDGITGVLFPPGDHVALANELVTLLEDPERRREMGLRGRAHVAEHYEWNNYIDRWVEFYGSIMHEARGTRLPLVV